MQSLKRSLIAAALAATAIAAALSQAGAATAATCVPRTNVEVILDDSGSMSALDSGKLRLAGTKLLLRKPSNAQKTFGAVQFGSDASTVFAPAVVAPALAGMESALDAQINADDGTTNYNAAFDKAKADNANANARMFLTDGGHNEGPYAEGHRGGPRTDVIGFGSSTAGDDGLRLARIASETGGTYHPETDASSLQATMNEIDAAYNCLPVPKTFSDLFISLGTKSHSLNVTGKTKSFDTVLSWSDPANEFDLVSATIVRKGRTVAVSRKRRKPAKLRITRTKGATFVAIKISRVKKGKLKLKLRANRLTQPSTLVTQITPSRRR